MAPIKFEEHIKEKLDGRKIQPSVTAWDKIAEELGATSATKKRGYMKYAIAASVVGLLVVSFFYYTAQNAIPFDDNQLVNQSGVEAIKEEKTTPTSIKKIVIKAQTEVETQRNSVKSVANNAVLPNQIKTTMGADQDLAFTINRKDVAPKTQSKVNSIKADELINSKINELVARVDSLELNNTTVTDAEIDALLRKAQDEILEQRIFRTNHKVDAMALLTEVEDELDSSFRDQLFETLKNGYLKVRTAVADRNN